MIEFLEGAVIGFMLTMLGLVTLGTFFLPVFLKYNDKINEELEDDVPPN
jgi:hypothetical protein